MVKRDAFTPSTFCVDPGRFLAEASYVYIENREGRPTNSYPELLCRQGVTNSDVPVGSLLVWPSLVTHPHRSRRITSGVKYSLTVWCELPLV